MSIPTPGKPVDDPIADIRDDVISIKASLPHLATKAELERMEGSLKAQIERVDGNIARMESSLIRWSVGAILASTGLAFTAAKLIH